MYVLFILYNVIFGGIGRNLFLLFEFISIINFICEDFFFVFFLILVLCFIFGLMIKMLFILIIVELFLLFVIFLSGN